MNQNEHREATDHRKKRKKWNTKRNVEKSLVTVRAMRTTLVIRTFWCKNWTYCIIVCSCKCDTVDLCLVHKNHIRFAKISVPTCFMVVSCIFLLVLFLWKLIRLISQIIKQSELIVIDKILYLVDYFRAEIFYLKYSVLYPTWVHDCKQSLE